MKISQKTLHTISCSIKSEFAKVGFLTISSLLPLFNYAQWFPGGSGQWSPMPVGVGMPPGFLGTSYVLETLGDVRFWNGPGMPPSQDFIEFARPNGENGMTLMTSAGQRADIRFDGTTLKFLANNAGSPPSVLNGITVNTNGFVGLGNANAPYRLTLNDNNPSALFGGLLNTNSSGASLFVLKDNTGNITTSTGPMTFSTQNFALVAENITPPVDDIYIMNGGASFLGKPYGMLSTAYGDDVYDPVAIIGDASGETQLANIATGGKLWAHLAINTTGLDAVGNSQEADGVTQYAIGINASSSVISNNYNNLNAHSTAIIADASGSRNTRGVDVNAHAPAMTLPSGTLQSIYGIFSRAELTTQPDPSSFTNCVGVYANSSASTYNTGIDGEAFNSSSNNYIAYSNKGVYGSARDAHNNYAFDGGASSLTDITSTNYGVNCSASGGDANSTNYGVNTIAIGSDINAKNYGVYSAVSGGGTSSENYGIFCKVKKDNSGKNYGIWAEALPSGISTNNWAGWFNGDFYYTGAFKSSDKKLKENINDVTNAIEKIKQLKPRTYNFKQDAEFRGMALPKGEQIGFIAQEIETVFPILIKNAINPERKDSAGNILSSKVEFKAVDYISLIPVLTAGIIEQQKMIDDNRSQIDSLINLISVINNNNNSLNNNNMNSNRSSNQNTSIGNNDVNNVSVLYQNQPNPFSENTLISYYLITNTTTASIMIFDMNGTLFNTIPLHQFGKNSVQINAGILKAGMYYYSLIADDKVIDTKKMIIKN